MTENYISILQTLYSHLHTLIRRLEKYVGAPADARRVDSVLLGGLLGSLFSSLQVARLIFSQNSVEIYLSSSSPAR